MPNQRSKMVKRVSFYVDAVKLKKFKEQCEKDNITMTDAFVLTIENYLTK